MSHCDRSPSQLHTLAPDIPARWGQPQKGLRLFCARPRVLLLSHGLPSASEPQLLLSLPEHCHLQEIQPETEVRHWKEGVEISHAHGKGGARRVQTSAAMPRREFGAFFEPWRSVACCGSKVANRPAGSGDRCRLSKLHGIGSGRGKQARRDPILFSTFRPLRAFR